MVVERGRSRRTGQTSSMTGGKVKVSASVVVTGGNGGAAGLRWAADEEAPLAGDIVGELKKVPQEPKKKVAKVDASMDVKEEKPSKNEGDLGASDDEDHEDVGHEDGFLAL
uniref:Uncharacterized protein n=1 Tax=Odontella aurita TaxID=265563 RepID=A0A7S4JI14_9STRA|mmetsp:Transcript_46830/g.141857  ORF Transcript_46830/g.141857 Transcript_46830/m.141857 type:complete len:111 (+) Transcript_46830:2-334(+)